VPARRALTTVVLAASAITGCYRMRPVSGGGDHVSFQPPRSADPADIAVPAGYRIDIVATRLTFPSGVAFDAKGRAYVTESGYSYGESWSTPRLVRIEADGRPTEIARGMDDNGPWNGVASADGEFYIAEGGERRGGRLLRVSERGETTTIVENLPSLGDHHTNGPAVSGDGWIYFGQGTATNSGVVGEDDYKFGWLARHPDFHDIPCRDVTLAGVNLKSKNPLSPGSGEVTTGAFQPFGTATQPQQKVAGRVPCSGAVMRVRRDGGDLQLVAWGLRNPFGLAFSPHGDLYVTDNAFDERGSRPVWGTGDLLWKMETGAWYGWPDFWAQYGIDADRFSPPGHDKPERLLATPPGTPRVPAAIFDVHSSTNGFDFSRSERFGHVGQIFAAQFGDMAPSVGKVLHPVGFKVVRVDPQTGVIEEFAVNKGRSNGPASKIGRHGFERPVAARFSPDGTALYVVDFGVMTRTDRGPEPRPETGVLWRITREAR
jgi:glucose/arabinose dehydrogenase